MLFRSIRLRMLLSAIKGIEEIYGFAIKEMTPVMLYAAAFDQKITRIALIEPYSSYSSLVMNRFYHTGFVHNLVAGALTEYDLPDLAATLAPRKLLMSGTSDGNGDKTGKEDIETDLTTIRNSYKKENSENQLIIIADPSVDHYEILRVWMK
mgnify:CR=1 FL=1